MLGGLHIGDTKILVLSCTVRLSSQCRVLQAELRAAWATPQWSPVSLFATVSQPYIFELQDRLSAKA
jgi:hypothetical protein